MRVVHASHPRASTTVVLRFESKGVAFDLFLLLGVDLSKGPVPRGWFLDPFACLPSAVGPFPALAVPRGRIDFPVRLPAGMPALGFFAAGFDVLTQRWSVSPLETIQVGDLPFQRQTIDPNNPTNPHCKALGDIDGDGHIDALAASSLGGSGLFWYDWNNNWKKHRIATGNYSVDMQTADIDGDGDQDVVIPSYDTGQLTWFENPRPTGDPAKGPWKAHKIGTVKLAHDVEVGDIEGDGDIDVVTREKTGTETVVWVHGTTPDSWTRVVVHKRGGEGTALGDIDGDGDLDLAHNGFWVETPSDLVNGTWTMRIIDGNWPADVGVHITDLDGNGTADVLLAPSESSNGQLAWYETNNPKTGPWTRHVIDSSVSFVHTFKTGDVDNDGDLDVVTAEMHQSKDDKVSIYYNDGNALAWTEQVIGRTGSHNIRIGDIGDDGDLDVFGANWNDSAPNSAVIEMWENQLSGIKKRRLSLDRWARHVIDANRPWTSVFIAAGDLDGDKRDDIITGGYWYRNPGRTTGPWTRRAFGGALYNMAAVADFDTDGDLDVLGTDGKVIGSKFTWARNDGAGNFTLLTSIAQGDGDFLQGVAIASFDASRRGQVALSWHDANKGIQFLTIPPDASKGVWTWKRISNVSQDEQISTGDIDRDGDRDLLLGTKWLRNDGASWSSHTVNPAGGTPDRNRLGDVNGDGRLDAIVGFEAINTNERVAWYEQPANPTGIWTEHVIARIVGPMSLDAGDIDGDGDLDVVAGEHNLVNPSKARLIVFENRNGRGTVWKMHVVYTGDEHHDGAQLHDIDGDGDLDVISIGWQSTRVVLYENLAIR